MTNLEKLVAADRELKAAHQKRERTFKAYVAPVDREVREIGERCNVLWVEVLREYGPGFAQDALRAAKGET